MNAETLLSAPVASTPRLRAFFEPRSVALIGASEQPGSVGRALMENLLEFPGPVFAVNLHHPSVLGRPAYPTVGAVPADVELALIATPASTVPDVIAECGACGVHAAIVLSAGFSEIGAAGRALQQRVLEVARQNGVRVLGPNCLGLVNLHAKLNATFGGPVGRAGNLAFLSQSGALCCALLDWSREERVGFSSVVSTGCMMDVGWAELLGHFGEDPNTTGILVYMESIGEAAGFLAAARKIIPHKPVVVLKPGRTAAAARAAASHTGALTGRDDVFDAAMRQAGVLRVDHLADLLAMATALSGSRFPSGRRLAIVTNAGGPGALAADALASGGGELATLTPATLDRLEVTLPPCWSHGNPIDVLGDADANRYEEGIRIALGAPETDGVLTLLTPQAMTDPGRIARKLVRDSATTTKPILACWLGGPSVQTGREILRAANIPMFPDPDSAVRTFNYLWRLAELRENMLPATHETGTAPPEACALLAGVARQGRRLLSELESKELMRWHGIRCVETRRAGSEDAAAEIAARLGFPVAVKLHSHTFTHKSDVRGVHLNLCNEDAVRAAWRRIRDAIEEQAGPGHFLGVTVQPMIQGDGRELILGATSDTQFGPVILFGAGGKFVELLPDRALALAPLGPEEARRLIAETKISRVLGEVRGLPAVDQIDLENLIVRFSQLLLLHPEIKAIDLNPLVVSDRCCLALDARVILHAPAGASCDASSRTAQSETLPEGTRTP